MKINELPPGYIVQADFQGEHARGPKYWNVWYTPGGAICRYHLAIFEEKLGATEQDVLNYIETDAKSRGLLADAPAGGVGDVAHSDMVSAIEWSDFMRYVRDIRKACEEVNEAYNKLTGRTS